MKTRLIIAMCLLGFTQSFAQSKLTPGIRAGLTMSTVTHIDGDYRPNFYIGLQLPIKFSRFYSLQPEINYSRQGTSNIQVQDFVQMKARTKSLTLDYIDVNILNKVQLNKITLQAGPGFAFLANASEPGLKSLDSTLNIGVGIQLTDKLGIEARWKYGLISLNDDGYELHKNTNISYINEGNLHNNLFQLGVNFKL